jgi:mgtE-like transporter
MAKTSVKRIIAESLPVLCGCMVISLFAGCFLNKGLDKIKEFSIIVMMVPAINGIGGNIGSILGARLTSALHLGTIKPKFKKQRTLNRNLSAVIVIALGIFSFIAILFFPISYLGGASISTAAKIMLMFLMASLMLTALIVFLTILFAFVSFSKGLDPDNLVIPLITSIGDMMGIVCLLISATLMGV